MSEIVPWRDGVLVESPQLVTWIEEGAGLARIVMHGAGHEVVDAVLDDDSFFIAVERKPYWTWKGKSFIHRVTRIGDEPPVEIAGPFRDISALATFGPNVYFMLRATGEVWSVPKAGGNAQVVINGPRETTCDVTHGLWADERGLFWSRGEPYFSAARTLYFLPWSATEPR